MERYMFEEYFLLFKLQSSEGLFIQVNMFAFPMNFGPIIFDFDFCQY